VEYERQHGNGFAGVICSANGHDFGYVRGIKDDTFTTGFAQVDEKGFGANASTTSVQRRQRPGAGGRQTLVVSVRRDRVAAYLNGVRTTFLKTNFANLELPTVCKKPTRPSLGILHSGESITIYSAQVIELNGAGDTPEDDQAPPAPRE
jgi:hypothetical protein